MKITSLDIQRFGIWQDVSLPIDGSGVNVLYGPNEAGKSTLLRFIRGVLYGYKPLKIAPPGQRADAEFRGAIHVEHGGDSIEIRREWRGSGRGDLSIRSGQHELSDDQLTELIGATDEKVFENVFAVGLPELQELATLHDDDIARHVYGISLGPAGQRLLEIISELDPRGGRFHDLDGKTLRLQNLFSQDEGLFLRLCDLSDLRDYHAELCQQRRQWDASIQTLKTRQTHLSTELRGSRFLAELWQPWNQVQETKRELERLPVIAGFPENGLSRLDELDTNIDVLTSTRDEVLNQSAELRKRAESLEIEDDVQAHLATAQSFIDQRDWLRENVEHQSQAQRQAVAKKAKFDEHLAALGSEWSEDRLARVDTSPTAYYRLVRSSRRYQSAQSRKSKLKKRCERLSTWCHSRQTELTESMKPFGESTPKQTLEATKQQVADLHQLAHLEIKQEELSQRQSSLSIERETLEEHAAIPVWVYVVLAFFAVSGVVLAVIGIVTGVQESVIPGAIYALLGVVCLAVAWKLTSHWSGGIHQRRQRIETEYSETETACRTTQDGIDRLNKRIADSVPKSAELSGSTPERITSATERLADLEHAVRLSQQIGKRRRKLTQLRSRIQGVQRDLADARQSWCELLTELHFSETVKVAEAFDVWQKVAEAREAHRQWQEAEDEHRRRRRTVNSFRHRMEQLGQRIPGWDEDSSDPLAVLSVWENRLGDVARDRAEQKRLRREESNHRREADELQKQLDALTTERSALLVQGGAAGREEFERRAETVIRRQELEEFLTLAETDLDAVAQHEPDLAIVEEDLLAYSEESNTQRIESLTEQLEELELELEEAFETLGRVKQEIATLENDDRQTKLLFERSQLQSELKTASEEWFAVQQAGAAVNRLRTRFEKTCQPAILAAASTYLDQLTGGKYKNVWTPLGQRHLCIDDEQQRTLRVEQLSNGTREQLFLAIRLAMVRAFADEGIALPMILDDVIVNFDQHRTEAAIDCLTQFAGQGTQVLLFTCHLHIAHLCEGRGVNTVWLPDHHTANDHRMAG